MVASIISISNCSTTVKAVMLKAIMEKRTKKGYGNSLFIDADCACVIASSEMGNDT